MKQVKLGKLRTQLKRDNKGYILTLVVIIMASVISVVLVSVSLSSVTSLEQSRTGFDQVKVEQYVTGCVHDGLIQLNRDNNYSGETYNLRDGTCEISVTDSGSNKNMSVTGTIDNYKHNLEIEVSLDPFEIVKWDV